MRSIEFFKVHGLGNDFVLVDGIADPEVAGLPWPVLAPRWCDRHTGIGADGVLLVLAGEKGSDARMRIFNGDGSEAQMCGNGIRCIARHLVMRHGRRERELRIATPRGVLTITWADGPGGFSATVDMGEPILEPLRIPVRGSGERFVEAPLRVPLETSDAAMRSLLRALGPAAARVDGGVEIRATAVSMGNPHAVVLIADAAGLPIDVIGPALERHSDFPEKVNAQFLQVDGPASATLRTWERGAGPTQACGTGACAALVAGVLTGRLGREADLRLPGGPLRIRWDEASGRVFMTGPAEEVFQARIPVTL